MKQQQAALSLWNKPAPGYALFTQTAFFRVVVFPPFSDQAEYSYFIYPVQLYGTPTKLCALEREKSKPSINDMGVVNDTAWMQVQIELQKCEWELHYCPCFSEQKDLREGI